MVATVLLHICPARPLRRCWPLGLESARKPTKLLIILSLYLLQAGNPTTTHASHHARTVDTPNQLTLAIRLGLIFLGSQHPMLECTTPVTQLMPVQSPRRACLRFACSFS
ncbi:hypothetical protein BOTBODRAFT_582545 [Botryobasidium botryosum FD-172 SS1]|uniref:Uncharacterized protein n=1 Tax=Botryobasidium botryosum (strain FD-172 SS1) TaxID=930990 RepID=A0A067MQB6_BOTB1|nr:hypothetical protein BOTBODRAFT_582545 [Botryobasidium botryosum FD-172 SS1]